MTVTLFILGWSVKNPRYYTTGAPWPECIRPRQVYGSLLKSNPRPHALM
jgi:hypothetical protein